VHSGFVYYLYVGKNMIAFYNGKRQTIQTDQCSVFLAKSSVNTKKCNPCEKHRQTLNRILRHILNEQGHDQNRTASDNHTNYYYLTSDEICEWMKRKHQEVVRSRRDGERLSGEFD